MDCILMALFAPLVGFIIGFKIAARIGAQHLERMKEIWLEIGTPICGRKGHGRMVCDDFEGEEE